MKNIHKPNFIISDIEVKRFSWKIIRKPNFIISDPDEEGLFMKNIHKPEFRNLRHPRGTFLWIKNPEAKFHNFGIQVELFHKKYP